MGAPVPPPFQIHLGLDKAIEIDMAYWRKESRRQSILACLLAGGTLLGFVAVALVAC